MKIDFHSKDEKKSNDNVYAYFGQKVTLINKGTIQFNNDDPYIYNNNFNFNNYNNAQPFLFGDEMNNFNNNINDNYNFNNNGFNNYNNNFHNDINNNNINEQNRKIIEEEKKNLPPPPGVNNGEEDIDLPSRNEVEKSHYNIDKNNNLEYPEI